MRPFFYSSTTCQSLCWKTRCSANLKIPPAPLGCQVPSAAALRSQEGFREQTVISSLSHPKVRQMFEISVPTAQIRSTKHFILIFLLSTTYFLENLEALHLPLQIPCQVPFSFGGFFCWFCFFPCSIFVSHVYYMVTNAVFLLTPHNRCVKHTHTHVLVGDCSLFPGSSCKT